MEKMKSVLCGLLWQLPLTSQYTQNKKSFIKNFSCICEKIRNFLRNSLKKILHISLRKKCSYSQFFWFIFSGIPSEYGELKSKLCIQSEWGKIQTRKTPTTHTLQAVFKALSIISPFSAKITHHESSIKRISFYQLLWNLLLFRVWGQSGYLFIYLFIYLSIYLFIHSFIVPPESTRDLRRLL